MPRKKKEIKEPEWKDLSTMPEIGRAVNVLFVDERSGNQSSYLAMWTGHEWLMRAPYTRMDFEPLPSHFHIIGWK